MKFSIPTKVSLKKDITEINEIARKLSEINGVNQLIVCLHIFMKKVLEQDRAHTELIQQYESLKIKNHILWDKNRKISQENTRLDSQILNKDKLISNLTFSKRNKFLSKELNYDKKFQHKSFSEDLSFNQETTEQKEVQCSDFYVNQIEKHSKVEKENEILKERLEIMSHQLDEKLLQNQAIREILNRYVQDIKIGGQKQQFQPNTNMLKIQENLSEDTSSQVDNCENYLSDDEDEEDQKFDLNQSSDQKITQFIYTEKDNHYHIPKNERQQQKNIENQNQTEDQHQHQGVIQRTYEAVLTYFRKLSQ